MEFLQHLVDTYKSDLPLLTAFVLGLMMALSPCPLAMNITATAYLSKDIANKKRVLLNGAFYTLGRIFTYTTLAMVILLGASKMDVSRWLRHIDGIWIGIALIVVGILMLDVIKFRIPVLQNLTSRYSQKQRKRNYINAFVMGVVFALAFCPYSGVLYFGVLIPMTIASPEGMLLPPIFALASGLPVIVIAYLLAYSVANVGKFYNKMKDFELWFRRIIATVFIFIGFYYISINI